MKGIEKKLWQKCREITFKKYGDVCYTCGQMGLEKQNRQLGHYYPKGALSASLKYDLRILRPQCYNCNINYGGMGGVYREKMRKEIGAKKEQKLFDECATSKGKPIKASDHYIKLLSDYDNL
jgi:hypothetical protein